MATFSEMIESLKAELGNDNENLKVLTELLGLKSNSEYKAFMLEKVSIVKECLIIGTEMKSEESTLSISALKDMIKEKAGINGGSVSDLYI